MKPANSIKRSVGSSSKTVRVSDNLMAVSGAYRNICGLINGRLEARADVRWRGSKLPAHKSAINSGAQVA